jgi:hypothetical protein
LLHSIEKPRSATRGLAEAVMSGTGILIGRS